MTARLILAILILSALTCCVSVRFLTAKQEAQLQQMEDTLRTAGPRATLKNFFNCETGVGYDLVNTGDPRAVKIAVEVLNVSDACVTEGVLWALGNAMSNNPRAVLPYVNQTDLLAASHICAPDSFDDSGDVAVTKQLLNDLRRTKTALEAVDDAALKENRDICIVVVKRYITNLENQLADGH